MALLQQWWSLDFWARCGELKRALPSRMELVRRSVHAADHATHAEQLRIWRQMEEVESRRSAVVTALLGLVASVVSIITGIWCTPSFYVSLVLSGLTARQWIAAVVPVNLIVTGIYQHLVGGVRTQDVYQSLVISMCWLAVTMVRKNIQWDVFKSTLLHGRDFRTLLENQEVFHKMLTSMFDAWCFCDKDGIIQSSTPQLDILLGTPGKENALRGLGLINLAANDAEKRRAQAFLSGAVGSDSATKITLSLNRNHSTRQVEVSLSAIRVGPQTQVSLPEGCFSEMDIAAMVSDQESMLFVAVQVLEAEPLCAVVDSESNERPLAEVAGLRRVLSKTSQEDWDPSLLGEEPAADSAVDPADAASGASRAGGAPPEEAPKQAKSSLLTKTTLLEKGTFEPCSGLKLKNTFLEVAESSVGTVFEEAWAQLGPRPLSAPGSIVHFQACQAADAADRSPGTRSKRSLSIRSGRSGTTFRSRRSGVSRPSKLSALGSVAADALSALAASECDALSPVASVPSEASEHASSAPSEASEEGQERQVVVACQVQDRSLLGPKSDGMVSLGPALAARRGGLRSVGSAGHAEGKCYPCLMQAWCHEGKAGAPCKFGLFCGRCHENHSQEHLKQLRKQQRRSKFAQRKAQQ